MNSAASSQPSPAGSPAQPISRRWAVIAFVASSVFTAALTVGGGYAAQVLQSHQADRKADYERFRDLTEKMDGLVTSYMDLFLKTASIDGDGNPQKPLPIDDPKLVARRKALETNIQDQNSALEEIAIGLPRADADVASRYLDEIVAANDELRRPVAAEQASNLMRAVAKARDTRVDLLAVLQARARRFI